MPYPEHLLSPGETVEREFRPHWRLALLPIFLGLVAAGAAVALAATLEGDASRIAAVAAVAAWLLYALPRLARWWFTRYIITNERIIVRSGILARAGKEIPLEVINDVSFSQSILERLLRSGDLMLESAGEQGQSRFTDVPRPQEVQAVVYRLREDRIGRLSTGRTPVDQLEALARLHRDGVLTDQEFTEKKHKLLGEI